jgi:hypothetical protein
LYLLSFVAAFAQRRIVPDTVVLKAMAAAILPVVLTMAAGFNGPAAVLIPLHLSAFFSRPWRSTPSLHDTGPGLAF